jgi:hypothetical protein
MSTPIQVEPVSVTMSLSIAGVTYPLAGCEVSYMLNGPAYVECSLSTGYINDGSGIVASGFLSVGRGTPAQIILNASAAVVDPVSGTILLNQGEQVAFSGVLDDSGPSNLNKGNFNLRARLVSKLYILMTGTLQMAGLVASSYIDTTGVLGATFLTGQNIAPAYAFNGRGLLQNFWTELQRGMVTIATQGSNNPDTQRGGVVGDYLAAFGTQVNTAAAAELNSIVGTLTPGPLNYENLTDSISVYLNLSFTTDLRMQSFYNRICDMSQEFKFKLVESFNGYAEVVPYSHFFPAALATTIYPSTVTDMNWSNQEPNSIRGVALTRSNIAGNSRPAGNSVPFLIGTYQRATGSGASPLGTVLAVPCPPWLSTFTDTFGNVYTPDIPVGIASGFGNLYAREWALEYSFRGYSMHLMCPLRTDIGVGMPVRVLYPSLAGIETPPSVYGAVQAVKLCMDAVKRQAYTLIEVGYVRSDTIQAAEPGLSGYTHPIWASQYAGQRLDFTG